MRIHQQAFAFLLLFSLFILACKGNNNKTIQELDNLHKRTSAKFEKIFDEYPNDKQKEKLKSFITQIHITINEKIKKYKIELEKKRKNANSRKR